MKKYFFLLMLILGLVACSSAPPPAEIPDVNEISFFESHSNIVADVMPEATEVTDTGYSFVIYEASFMGDLFNENLDVIAIVLLLFTTIFGALWGKVRSKVKSIGELFLKAYEYTDDKKLDPEEREDLKRRFLEILNKTPT
jgi:hypothetical protein